MNYLQQYKRVREATENICAPLKIEDYVVQPVVDTSPPKWHLGHTTWFFETFILKEVITNYRVFNADYNYVFNSYYETVGVRVLRTDRGNLSRPTVDEVYKYRHYVDEHMTALIRDDKLDTSLKDLLLLGLNHEQQHQELLLTDIKYILGHNPLFPKYKYDGIAQLSPSKEGEWINIQEGLYDIGHKGDGFCFDNELRSHKVFLSEYNIASRLVTNGEYLEFIKACGYNDFKYWHADGWDWVKSANAKAPLYWHFINNEWHYYKLDGLQKVQADQPVCHVNYYEAAAYAAWKDMRLPTENEWEIAAKHFDWGERWGWTESAYLPYPGFKKSDGAIGEYNGKFMVNQMVLRGASIATPAYHSRITYRNFFYPYLQWQFTGIRLAK